MECYRAGVLAGIEGQSSVAGTEASSAGHASISSSSLPPVSSHSPSASAAASDTAAAGQVVSGWVEFLRRLLVVPNGSSHSSWGPAVLTGEETCRRKGQALGVKYL